MGSAELARTAWCCSWAALVTAVVVVVFARWTAPSDEAAAIRRRYAAMLVRVHPMAAPQGRPVIDVTTFATVAKLAERYGLLVLHGMLRSGDVRCSGRKDHVPLPGRGEHGGA